MMSCLKCSVSVALKLLVLVNMVLVVRHKLRFSPQSRQFFIMYKYFFYIFKLRFTRAYVWGWVWLACVVVSQLLFNDVMCILGIAHLPLIH